MSASRHTSNRKAILMYASSSSFGGYRITSVSDRSSSGLGLLLLCHGCAAVELSADPVHAIKAHKRSTYNRFV